MAPFKGPRNTSCVASGTTEKQGHRQVWPARRTGPRPQLTRTLIVRLFKTHFFTLFLDCNKSTEKKWGSGQTWNNAESETGADDVSEDDDEEEEEGDEENNDTKENSVDEDFDGGMSLK